MREREREEKRFLLGNLLEEAVDSQSGLPGCLATPTPSSQICLQTGVEKDRVSEMVEGTEIAPLVPKDQFPAPHCLAIFQRDFPHNSLRSWGKNWACRPLPTKAVSSRTPPPACHPRTHFCPEKQRLHALLSDGISYMKENHNPGRDKCCPYAERLGGATAATHKSFCKPFPDTSYFLCRF